MATIGSSAAGEGPEFIGGDNVCVTRLQMPEAGSITAIENFLTAYNEVGPHNYYAVIYRGTFSSPGALAYAGLVIGVAAGMVSSHTLTTPITADEDEYLWGGILGSDGLGVSYASSVGSADAPASGHTIPPDPLVPDYVENDYRWSCALIYTADGAGVTGTIDSTLADAVSSTSGSVSVAGTVSSTLANATVSASGSVSVLGSVSSLLANAVIDIDAEVSVAGSISSTLANSLPSITGLVSVDGAISSTLANAAVSIVGTVGSEVTGSISSVLGATTTSIDGNVSVTGSISSTLANASASISGEIEVPGVSGTISSVLANSSLSAEGVLLVSGVIAASTANAVANINGALSVTGTISSTLANARARIRGLSGEDTGNDDVYTITSRQPKGVSLASSAKTITARKL